MIWTGFDLHQHTQPPLKLRFGALIWISMCAREGWWLHWTHAVNTDAKWTGAMKENLCAIYIRPHTSLQSSHAVMHCKSDWLVWYWEIAPFNRLRSPKWWNYCLLVFESIRTDLVSSFYPSWKGNTPHCKVHNIKAVKLGSSRSHPATKTPLTACLMPGNKLHIGIAQFSIRCAAFTHLTPPKKLTFVFPFCDTAPFPLTLF